jgi:hypothetical protein
MHNSFRARKNEFFEQSTGCTVTSLHGLLASQSRREETRNSRCEFIWCLVGVFGHVRRRVHGWCMDEAVGNDSLTLLALVLV